MRATLLGAERVKGKRGRLQALRWGENGKLRLFERKKTAQRVDPAMQDVSSKIQKTIPMESFTAGRRSSKSRSGWGSRRRGSTYQNKKERDTPYFWGVLTNMSIEEEAMDLKNI